MAVLSDTDRHQVVRDLVQKLYAQDGDVAHLDIVAIREYVDYCDDWVEANIASFVAGVPEPAKSLYNARQKTFAFAFTVKRRAEIL